MVLKIKPRAWLYHRGHTSDPKCTICYKILEDLLGFTLAKSNFAFLVPATLDTKHKNFVLELLAFNHHRDTGSSSSYSNSSTFIYQIVAIQGDNRDDWFGQRGSDPEA